MSLVDNLNLILSYKSEIKQAISDKGVDMTSVPLSGYADKISEINTGITPSGTYSITSNGTFDVTSYASANVSVPQSVNGYTLKDILQGDNYPSVIYDSSCTYLKRNALGYIQNITEVSLPNCSLINDYALESCTSLNKLILLSTSLCNITRNALYGISSTVSILVPYSLVESYKTYLSYYASIIFANLPTGVVLSGSTLIGDATSITSGYITSLGISPTDVYNTVLPYLTSIGEYTFQNHTNLSSLSNPLVTYYGDYAFKNCTTLTSINIEVSNAQAGTSIFEGCNNLSDIFVVYPFYSYYLSATNWSQYSSYMKTFLPELGFVNGLLYGSYSGNLSSEKWKETGGNSTTLISVLLPNCASLSTSAFQYCGNLTTVSMENCTYINTSGFEGCKKLSSVYLPNVSYIGGVVFIDNYAITELNLPRLTFMSGATIWGNNMQLTTLSLPVISGLNNWYGNPAIYATQLSQLYIGTKCYYVTVPNYNSFMKSTTIQAGTGSIYTDYENYSKFITATGWSSLSSMFVSVGDPTKPMLSYSDGLLYGDTEIIWSSIPYTRNSITGASLSKVFRVQSFGFQSTNITSLDLPECEYIEASGFFECRNLSSITLPKCKYIGAYGFQLNSNIYTTITLGASSVCQLGNTVHRFRSIYVPASLVDAYKSATNWVNFSNQIFSIQE